MSTVKHRAIVPVLLVSFFALGALGACNAAASRDGSAAATAAEPAVAAESARLTADVAWLADDARDGRRAGTEGERAAGDWLAARFAMLGLLPAGDGGSYFQSFTVPLPARDAGGSDVRDMDSGARFASAESVAPLFCSGAGEGEGRAVFVGWGAVREGFEWDDFEGFYLTGRVAVVLRGTPPESVAPPRTDAAGDPVSWGDAGSIFQKVMHAKHRGAVAVLVVQDVDDPTAAPMAFDPTRAALARLPALAIRADVFRGLFDLEPDEGLPERGRVGHFVRARANVLRGEGEARNVLARLRGRDSTRCVVVGAHYDHLGRGGEGSLAPGETGQVHNGADDNASGTAAVLEIARLLAAGPPPATDVVFALWSGEELGLLGSEHWLRYPTVALDGVRANLNLDMVGRADDGALTILGAGTSSSFGDWVEATALAAGLAPAINRSGQGVGGSDHQSFLKRRIPALHLFSGLHADYHRPSDDAERFEADGARRVVEFGARAVLRMAAAPDLAWTEVPAEEEQAGRARGGGFSVWFGTVPEYAYDGRGVLLAGTSPGSPAEKAGMLAGDVLVGVGDIEIGDIHDFVYALGVYKPGDVVLARFLRGEQEERVRMTLASRAVE